MKRLVFFTNSFPYGVGEEWKYNDLDAFRKRFDEIVVVPFVSDGTDPVGSPVPSGVEVRSPLFKSNNQIPVSKGIRQTLLTLLRDPILRDEILPYCKTFQLKQIRRCFRGYFRGRYIAESISNAGIWANARDIKDTTLFFCWGLGAAEGLPWLPDGFSRVVACYHGFDLYESRNANCPFPFRRHQLNRIDLAAPCSEDGVRALAAANQAFASKIKKRTLGTRDFGVAPWHHSKVLRLVSCAFVSPVKRLNLLVDALSLCECPVSWTHIGGGEDFDDLLEYANLRLRDRNASVQFLGSLRPSDVRHYLSTTEIDALVSTSEYEGLPVSMMEAISAGIPIIGTDVGGVREIIDSSVGVLMPANPTADQIAKTIEQFSELNDRELAAIRHNAREKFVLQFRVPDVIEKFANAAFRSDESSP